VVPVAIGASHELVEEILADETDGAGNTDENVYLSIFGIMPIDLDAEVPVDFGGRERSDGTHGSRLYMGDTILLPAVRRETEGSEGGAGGARILPADIIAKVQIRTGDGREADLAKLQGSGEANLRVGRISPVIREGQMYDFSIHDFTIFRVKQKW
jgi:hypothetical protein